jgi:hypothetical protein
MIKKMLGNFRESEGTIVKAGKAFVLVAFCPSGHNHSQCHNCTLCSQSKSIMKMRIKTDNASTFKNGQIVNIRRFVFHEALSAFLLFGLPIAAALLPVFIFSFQHPDSAGEKLLFILSVSGFAAGIVSAILIDRLTRMVNAPQITPTQAGNT